MRFARTLTVSVPIESAWSTLWDVQSLASCVPGCRDVTVVEERKSYRATITERVGPMSVTFPLTITVLEAQPPRRLRISATGDDRRVASRIGAEVELALSPMPDGGTQITIISEVTVHGRLASLGHAVITRRAEEELEAFGTALARQLNATTSRADRVP